jgi:hypothetical protein
VRKLVFQETIRKRIIMMRQGYQKQMIIFLLLLPLIFICLNLIFPYQKSIPIKKETTYASASGAKEVKSIGLPVDKHGYYRDKIIKILVSIIIGCMVNFCLLKNCNIFTTGLSATAIGALYFFSVLGTEIVVPTNIAWLMEEIDWAQHFLGWHLFRDLPWDFPLGKLSNILHPIGASIGYTDSIPLMAFIFKPFTRFLPDNFQYIGIWLVLCFCLQGLFGALLIRTQSNNLFIQLLGATFFIISPILLGRIGHPALCSQWLLLAALWLYFKKMNVASPYTQIGGWVLIVILSAAVHPYINIMILSLAIAFYLRLWLVNHSIRWNYCILSFGPLFFLTCLVWWISGYFEIGRIGGSYGTFGYGYFSLNLASPINPIGWSEGIWSKSCSTFLKSWPAVTKGQAEGFNYLGIGVITLGLWVFYGSILRPPKFSTIKPFLPLVFICVCFTILALSYKISFANHIIVDFKLNQYLLSALSPFRSSGRFFWPVHYFILFSIFTFLIRRVNLNLLFLFMIIGLTLQLADFHPMYVAFKRIRHPQKEWSNPLQSKLWTEVGKHYQQIVIVPPQGCTEKAAVSYIPFAYLAANHNMSINSFYLARYNYHASHKYCSQLISDIKNGMIDSDSIYILNKEYLKILKDRVKSPVICATIDGFNVCVSDQGEHINSIIEKMKDISYSKGYF